MYDRVQKPSSSWTPGNSQKKSSKYGLRTFSVQPKRDTKSVQNKDEQVDTLEKERPTNSRDAFDSIYTKIMRSLETKAETQAPTDSLQRQEKSNDDQKKLVQTKLMVGASGDKYEQEADRVAQQVMSMPEPAASPQSIQRQVEEEEPLQRQSLAESITPVVQLKSQADVSAKSLVQRSPTPPGDCTPSEHRQLQDEVNEWCKNKPTGCKSTHTLAELEERIENITKCIAARNRINHRCFRGGDLGHQEAVQVAVNTLIRCQEFKNKVKVPQTSPLSVPQADPDFMTRMSQLTGLTGATLIMYLIISEGSRLFPPRNLIPVP